MIQSVCIPQRDCTALQLHQPVLREVLEHPCHRLPRRAYHAPVGFTLIDGDLQVNQAEVPTIQRIFTEYLSGNNSREIAAALNKDKALGRHWRREAIDYILQNERYVITHCAPTSIALIENRHNEADPLTDFLQEVKERAHYHYWLFGHYHDNRAIDEKHILLWEQIIQVI